MGRKNEAEPAPTVIPAEPDTWAYLIPHDKDRPPEWRRVIAWHVEYANPSSPKGSPANLSPIMHRFGDRLAWGDMELGTLAVGYAPTSQDREALAASARSES